MIMFVKKTAFGISVLCTVACLATLRPALPPPQIDRAPLASPDPVWKRLGFPEAPGLESGRGVGVVLLDDTGLHPALGHLGKRLRHLSINDELDVSLIEPPFEAHPADGKETTHGAESLLQMASSPFRAGGQDHGGVAPGASYFVVPYLSEKRDEGQGACHRYDPRLDIAIAWIVENRERFNVRVILLETWFEFPPPPSAKPGQDGLVKNTKEYPIVRALQPAIDAGILVVTGNGNTSTLNNGPPAEYLAVGAYRDFGHAGSQFRQENPDEPWGRNGDGHPRPDVLAPKYSVPNHVAADGTIAEFGGTSSASAQVAGLCAVLFSRFPHADSGMVKRAIISSGQRLTGSHRPGVCVNAARAIEALQGRQIGRSHLELPVPIRVTKPYLSITSSDEVERALAISALALDNDLVGSQSLENLRRDFWGALQDESRMVRKAAASALGSPTTKEERARFWQAMRRERDMGVRGQLAILLSDGAGADHLDDWIGLAEDPNWTARWCLSKILRENYPDAPALDPAFVPGDIGKKAALILAWYRDRQAYGVVSDARTRPAAEARPVPPEVHD